METVGCIIHGLERLIFAGWLFFNVAMGYKWEEIPAKQTQEAKGGILERNSIWKSLKDSTTSPSDGLAESPRKRSGQRNEIHQPSFGQQESERGLKLKIAPNKKKKKKGDQEDEN